jgi:hypothetical protein
MRNNTQHMGQSVLLLSVVTTHTPVPRLQSLSSIHCTAVKQHYIRDTPQHREKMHQTHRGLAVQICGARELPQSRQNVLTSRPDWTFFWNFSISVLSSVPAGVSPLPAAYMCSFTVYSEVRLVKHRQCGILHAVDRLIHRSQ